MSEIASDIMAVISVILNGLPQGLLALTFGFASIPTAFAFFVGAIGNFITGSVAPISFQAETITYAGTMGKDKKEMCSMIFIGAAIMAVIGLCGMLTKVVDFIGPEIAAGMMAGVGLMLAKVSVDMLKKDKIIGIVSLISAIVTYAFSQDLVYTITISVILSCIAAKFFVKDANEEMSVAKEDKIERQKLSFNAKILRGALGMVCLNIGSNISFGAITGSMANTEVNIDHLSVISSLADMVSSFFGGAPVESIISATGSAPHALWAGIAMMFVMGLILIFGLLPKIGKYVPASSICGFLFVLGVFVTVPGNCATAVATTPMVGGITMAVTAVSDPFIGMIAGILARFIFI
ncbi:NCS2 family permease [Anaerofustis butyriciformans]|uniref:NCS2 family permease n=1 Tax=Anaerofustis TaxID=264995 RepID=UPI003F88F10E